MGHGSNNGNIALLLQRKGVVVVFQQNNGLLVQLSSELDGFLAVDELVPLRLGSGGIGVFKEAHLELRSQQSRDCGVDSFDIKLAGLDQFRDLPEIALHMSARNNQIPGKNLQRTTAHLDVVTGRKNLESDGVHVNRVASAELECRAQSIRAAGITHDKVIVAPFTSQDLGQSMVVGNSRDAIIPRQRLSAASYGHFQDTPTSDRHS
jgi:hypothetical protein